MGRNVYFFAALAAGVEVYDVTLKTTSSFPLEFPAGFPISGALALILVALCMPLAVHLVRELFIGIDGDLLESIKLDQEASQLRQQLKDSTSFKGSVNASTRKGWLLSNNPQIINGFGWIAFFIEAILPLICGIIVIIYCFSSICGVLSYQGTPKEEIEWCDVQTAFLSGFEGAGGNDMTNQTIRLEDDAEEALERRVNPDGSMGGYVSSLATVPATAVVPFSSMICRGAVLQENQVVSENVYIDGDNVEKPSKVTRMGKITVTPNGP